MTKVARNTSTQSARAFWTSAQKASTEVRQWPEWKRAGINVSSTRTRADQAQPAQAAQQKASGNK